MLATHSKPERWAGPPERSLTRPPASLLDVEGDLRILWQLTGQEHDLCGWKTLEGHGGYDRLGADEGRSILGHPLQETGAISNHESVLPECASGGGAGLCFRGPEDREE